MSYKKVTHPDGRIEEHFDSEPKAGVNDSEALTEAKEWLEVEPLQAVSLDGYDPNKGSAKSHADDREARINAYEQGDAQAFQSLVSHTGNPTDTRLSVSYLAAEIASLHVDHVNGKSGIKSDDEFETTTTELRDFLDSALDAHIDAAGYYDEVEKLDHAKSVAEAMAEHEIALYIDEYGREPLEKLKRSKKALSRSEYFGDGVEDRLPDDEAAAWKEREKKIKQAESIPNGSKEDATLWERMKNGSFYVVPALGAAAVQISIGASVPEGYGAWANTGAWLMAGTGGAMSWPAVKAYWSERAQQLKAERDVEVAGHPEKKYRTKKALETLVDANKSTTAVNKLIGDKFRQRKMGMVSLDYEIDVPGIGRPIEREKSAQEVEQKRLASAKKAEQEEKKHGTFKRTRTGLVAGSLIVASLFGPAFLAEPEPSRMEQNQGDTYEDDGSVNVDDGDESGINPKERQRQVDDAFAD